MWSIPLHLKFHSLPLRLTFSLSCFDPVFAAKVSYIVELSGLDLLKEGREIMPYKYAFFVVAALSREWEIC